MSGSYWVSKFRDSVYHPARRTSAYLVQGLTFPLKSENSFSILFLGGLLSLPSFQSLVVPQILVVGYLVDILARTIREAERGPPNLPLPNVSDGVAFLREGAQAYLVFISYTLIPQVIFVLFVNPPSAVATNLQDYLTLLTTVFPSLGGLTVIRAVSGYIENQLLVVGLFEEIPFLRPYRAQLPLALFTLVLMYAAPAALSFVAESDQNTVVNAIRVENLRPILSRPEYFVGWLAALPLFFYYFFGVSYLYELAENTLPILVGMGTTLLVTTAGFYALLAGLYIVGRAYCDVRTTQLEGYVAEVVSIFRSPRSSARVGESAIHPGSEWFEDAFQSEEEFERNRELLHMWVRRILPKNVMYRLNSPYGTVGHRVPDNTHVVSDTIFVERVDFRVTLSVWYS